MTLTLPSGQAVAITGLRHPRDQESEPLSPAHIQPHASDQKASLALVINQELDLGDVAFAIGRREGLCPNSTGQQ